MLAWMHVGCIGRHPCARCYGFSSSRGSINRDDVAGAASSSRKRPIATSLHACARTSSSVRQRLDCRCRRDSCANLGCSSTQKALRSEVAQLPDTPLRDRRVIVPLELRKTM